MTTIAKNKFVKALTKSNGDIRETRALQVAQLVEIKQQTLVNDLSQQLTTLRIKLEDLCDLSPTSTTSTRAVGKEFNAESWVKEVHSTKLEIVELEVQLDVATATYKEWFGSDEPAPEGTTRIAGTSVEV